ncbi:MAG TPA: PIN domain-containing protein [Anaerolineae bacterium]|nr:PIN domain-containing protein [Anaerolineae bacterium]HMR64796.1 PIN domain-containing protein [Anaerolineae bacterium]
MPSSISAFIDTNVWLYAFIAGQDSQKTERAQTLLGTLSAITVSAQVINEVCVNLIKRQKFAEDQIRDVINDYYNIYTVIELDQPILLSASSLREQYSLSYWDRLIVACALITGVPILYSEDMQDGLTINQQLRIVNPFK